MTSSHLTRGRTAARGQRRRSPRQGGPADYWSEGLRHIPDLRFEVVGVYVGLHTLMINYRNQKGGLVNEAMTFDGTLVIQGPGPYLGTDANPAGATPR